MVLILPRDLRGSRMHSAVSERMSVRLLYANIVSKRLISNMNQRCFPIPKMLVNSNAVARKEGAKYI